MRPRLLIFVIAYFAESTLNEVLERIPRTIFDEYEAEILVVDDASSDRTFDIGGTYRESHPELRVTVLRNEYNQGYGGNQKVGYTFAIAEKFDFVAMIHGDGQYAPEELPNLLTPLRAGEADAVFGSRMMERFGALKGGMPLYKYVGNKILSKLQNKMLGTDLSEFHSGYRIYSVNTLKQLPFQLNSNDFHFDTEIIIQLIHARARIAERPIPTYYGSEICRVNGMKYAGNVMQATVRSVLHRTGLLYQRRFDTDAQDNTVYDLKLGYPSSHTYALESIPPHARVLDIGSGPGEFAKELLRRGATVTVVDQYASPVDALGLKAIQQNLDEPLRIDLEETTHILMLDIIEHLRDPERFVAELRQHFTYDTKTVLLTTPNIAFIVQRLMLLLGQFNYGKRGVLDRTHTRLFTFRSIEQLLDDAGYRIKDIRGVPAPFPKVLGEGILGKAAVRANVALIGLSRTLFSYQIFIRAETTPSVEFVLSHTQAVSTARLSSRRGSPESPQTTRAATRRR